MFRRATALVLVLMVGFIWACSDDDNPPPTGDSTVVDASTDAPTGDMGGGDMPAGDTATGDTATAGLAATVQPIFTASCASSTCHGGGTPKGGMSLESGNAYAALVGVASLQCSTLKRVEAGAPDKSYLVQKVEGAGTCFTNQKMPIGGSLTSQQIDAIKAWITAGAKND